MAKFIVRGLLVGLLSAGYAAAAEPAAIDPRFDGKWIGTETFYHNNSIETWAGKAPQVKAILVIADHGKTIGFIAGFAPGKYIISPKSKGNTIFFDSALRKAKLTLSADGNTITEDGAVAINHLLCEVNTKFHRYGNQN